MLCGQKNFFLEIFDFLWGIGVELKKFFLEIFWKFGGILFTFAENYFGYGEI